MCEEQRSLSGLPFKGASKTGKEIFLQREQLLGTAGARGGGQEGGLCLEGSSVLEPAGARSDWERDGAGCCSS